MTFAQFLFIAVEGFLFEADLGRKHPAIPIRYGALKSLFSLFFSPKLRAFLVPIQKEYEASFYKIGTKYISRIIHFLNLIHCDTAGSLFLE